MSLRKTIVSLWSRYLHADVKGYCALLAPDVLRLSRRASGVQRGPGQVASGLPKEFRGFEKAHGMLAERITVRRAELWVDGSAATALYWVAVEGGVQHLYHDQGLVFQAFKKSGGQWKLTYQTDSWDLSYDLTRGRPGPAPGCQFDFVYPAQSLGRALAFYTPLLGSPESVTNGRITFNLNGSRFILDNSSLQGCALIKPGLPNGYAVFHVAGLAAQRKRLEGAGVAFLKSSPPLGIARDPVAVGADPMGNVFVLEEKRMNRKAGPSPGRVRGFTGSSPYEAAAAEWAGAWLKSDGAALATLCGQRGRYFDDSRARNRGLEGAKALLSSLPNYYWKPYDRSPSGLAARMDVTAVQVQTYGSRTLVSYQMTLTGTGLHPFRDSAYVTQFFASPSEILLTLVVTKPLRDAQALEFDYAAYPVTNQKLARHFYGDVLKFGVSASEGPNDLYPGHPMFATYVTAFETDGLPKPRKTNGYVCIWVRSLTETEKYLRAHGATFPNLKSLSAGAAHRLYAADCEGNGILFAEYRGRPR